MKRIALITGVAGGIGAATAILFADAGWHVIGLMRRPVTTLPGVHHLIRADVSDDAQMQRALAEVAAVEGRINALVNNAAIQISKPLTQTTTQEWDSVMGANLRSAYLAVRYAHPLLLGHAAAIVNVSSVHAMATSVNVAAYAATKGALVALTRALAIEFAADGIRVNALLPGAVDTPMLRSGLRRGHLTGSSIEDLLQDLGRRTVMGRVGQPQEIAKAILFLADGDWSSFMTGQTLVVDGGATARLSTE
jgi:glucose 1-dehydrogenase